MADRIIHSGQKNLTRGNMTANLISFAIPFLLANLLQALYGAVDLWVVGKFGGGKIGTAAVANGGEIMHLVMSFVMGLTTGATVLIGHYFGARDKVNVNRSIGMTISLTFILGIAATLGALPLVPAVIKLLNVPMEAVEQTFDYMTICSCGIFFIVGYNALSAIFRGFGNSAAPLLFVGISCVINILGDLLLVAYFNLGPAGAAWATIFAQCLSMIFAFFYLLKGDFGFSFTRDNLRIRLELAKKFLKTGIPIATQGILISLSFLFIISIVNAMGGSNSAPSAAYGIVNRINGFAMLPAMSFAMAMAAITAQNIGANKPVRAVKTLWLAVTYTMAAGCVFLVLMQFFPAEMVGLFIDKNSPGASEVIASGVLYAKSFSWDYILVPIVFCTNGFFNGCGRAFFSMSNNLACTFLIRVPVSYFFSIMPGATLTHVGYAAPLASLTSNIVALTFLISGRWHKKPAKNGNCK